MATATLRPEASGDDGHWRGWALYTTDAVAFGIYSDVAVHGFVRLPASVVPQGAQILSAVPRFVAQIDGGAAGLSLCFAAVDNPAVPTSSGELAALARTSVVAWSPGTWVAGGVYTGPDLAAALQEVVDRAGYAEGNAVLLLLISTGGGLGHAHSVDTSYANRVALDVEWSTAGSVDVPPISGVGQLHAPAGSVVSLLPISGVGSLLSPTTAAGRVLPAMAGVGRLYAPGGAISATIPALAGEGRVYRPSPVWSLPAAQLPAAQVVYTLTLTGAADGRDDVTLPMSSFQTRLNEGGVHYLSAVVPNSTAWASEIEARQQGELVVRKGYRLRDGSIALSEIVRATFSALSWARGSTGDSATVTGSATVPVLASKSVTVTGVQYEALDSTGKRRVRCDVSKDLAPGDWCLWSGGSMQVGEIVHYVGDAMGYMEVVES